MTYSYLQIATSFIAEIVKVELLHKVAQAARGGGSGWGMEPPRVSGGRQMFFIRKLKGTKLINCRVYKSDEWLERTQN